MNQLDAWALPFALAIFAAGAALAVWQVRRDKTPRPPRPRKDPDTHHELCSACHREMVFHRSELVAISPSEIALLTREHPGLAKRNPAEYVCPYCETAHIFSTKGRALQWVAACRIQAQAQGARCQECRKPLRPPAWPKGTYDKRLGEIPQLQPDHGLICSRCGAVNCVECCTRSTKRRTKDGSLTCPRCFRGPVDAVYHQ